jgi:hypothetical protein
MIRLGDNSTAKLTLYGIHGKMMLDIFSSNLIDKATGKTISARNITFDSHPNLTINLDSGKTRSVSVSAHAADAGFFTGDVFMMNNGNTTSLPISIGTSPLYVAAIEIMSIGIGVSIILWSVASYISLGNQFNSLIDEVKYLNSKVDTYQKLGSSKYDLYLAIMKVHLNEFIGYINRSQIDVAKERFGEANEIFDQMKSPDNLDAVKVQNAANLRNVPPLSYLNIIQKKPSDKKAILQLSPWGPLEDILAGLQGSKFSVKKYLTLDKLRNNFIISSIAVIVGIIVVYSVALQQNYINTLRVIQPWDYIILIGIGLGIDNVKQLIAKYVSLNSDGS